jgi:hypothetical protein
MTPELFRHYEFERDEIFNEVSDFLKKVGYQLHPPTSFGFVFPDIHGERISNKERHEVFCVIRGELDELTDGLIQLQAIKNIAGKEAEYSIILPPPNEYLLIEFLEQKGGWIYRMMKEMEIMMWFCNPKEKYIWCISGGSRDPVLNASFILGKMNVDQVIGMKIMRQSLLEEEEF